MQDRPLVLTHFFDRAERLFPEKGVVTFTGGGLERITYGDWAERTRRLATVLDQLGISADGRVATFAWNTSRHLELYFAAPCSGRVLHTLNIRLFPEQLTYIVNHAEDEVIFVDKSLLGLLLPLARTFTTVKHIVVMDDGIGRHPRGHRRLRAARLRGAAGRRRARRVPRRRREPGRVDVLHERHHRATRRASSTATGRRGCTPSPPPAPTCSACSERDRILPVVPMFHVNAWGLPHAVRGHRRRPGHARPRPLARRRSLRSASRTRRSPSPPACPPSGWACSNAIDGQRPLEPAGHRVRRLGGAPGPVGGLPGEDRHPHHPGLGHDRDQPARLGRPS